MSASDATRTAASRGAQLRLAAALAAWPLGFAALHLAAGYPDFVERVYSRGAYGVVRGVQRAVAGVSPVSLSELAIGVLLVWLAWRAIRALRAWRRGQRRPRQSLVRAAYELVLASAVLWIAFLLLWGFQHARRPYAWHAGLELAPVSDEELVEVSSWLVDECNHLRPEVDDADFELADGPGGADPRLREAYRRLGRRVPALAGGSPLLRRPLSSPLLSLLGISGIYSPFTGEAHLNAQIRPWLQPFAACHELAHQKGFAREDEASLIAWQACRGSGQAAFEYSATLVATRFALHALAKRRPHEAAELHARLDDAVLADLEANRSFWRAKHSSLTEVATRVNDTYLKSAGSDGGVASYGRMLDGLVAEWRRDRAREAAAAPEGPAPSPGSR